MKKKKKKMKKKKKSEKTELTGYPQPTFRDGLTGIWDIEKGNYIYYIDDMGS
jgi:hypothetical protein